MFKLFPTDCPYACLRNALILKSAFIEFLPLYTSRSARHWARTFSWTKGYGEWIDWVSLYRSSKLHQAQGSPLKLRCPFTILNTVSDVAVEYQKYLFINGGGMTLEISSIFTVVHASSQHFPPPVVRQCTKFQFRFDAIKIIGNSWNSGWKVWSG